jgi:beta-N-acetylglucosaminidase
MKLEIKHDTELEKLSNNTGISNTQIANLLIQKALHKHQCKFYQQNKKCSIFNEIELSECAFCPFIRL